MASIDFILNLAALLLWINWRAVGFTRGIPSAISLAATLKRPAAHETSRWQSLAALAALLLLRAVFYWHMGSAVNWTPALNLGAIALPLRSDIFGRMLLFSLTTFGLTLGMFYSWLLLLSVVNRHLPDSDFFQKMIRLHLGRVESWSAVLKIFLPMLAAGLLWAAMRKPLIMMGIVPGPIAPAHLLQESFLIGLAAFISWKYLIGGFLALYILTSYVYLGNHNFWHFVAETGRNLVAPLKWIPLRLGRLDFTPFLAIALVWAGLTFGARELTWFYRQLPLKWPLI